MKLTIPKSTLSSALGAVSSVCGRALPILGFCKVDSPNEALIEISATDLDCHYRRTVEAAVEEPGSCLLPVSSVKEWLNKVGNGDVTLEAVGSVLKLSTEGSGVFKLNAMPVEEFPPDVSGDQTFIAEADFSPIKHIDFAIIDDKSGRPMLEAVFIEPENDGIICASADGRKVATVFIKAKRDEHPWVGVSLPSKYVGHVAGLGVCQLSESQNNLHFVGSNFHITVRKTEHKIPSWRKSIYNQDFPVIGSITVMREELAQAVSQCHIFRCRELGSEHGVRVSFGKVDGGMSVSCFVDKTGDSYSNIIAGRIKGEFPNIIFSTEHIEPFLSLPDESPLKIEFTGGKTMAHFCAPDIGVDAYICPMFPKEEKA